MTYRELLLSYLREDLGDGDITSEALLDGEVAVGQIICKEDCILAGVREAEFLFGHQGLSCDCHSQDGDPTPAGTVVLTVRGDAADIFKVERLVLNILMRMSGIATLVADLTQRVRAVNPDVRIAATRKTTPGFRIFEKRAVMLGGGDPHRMALDDAVIIKDNHIRTVGGVGEALHRARKVSFSKKVEIEAQCESEAVEAARSGADIIMLDNMGPEDAKEAANAVRAIDPDITIEISGGITPENCVDYAAIADVISLGWLTHSVKSIDFSLNVA
ncbi:MAG: carboxylating nicotinate-nucleotide diphosphorylase [Thermoplasmata archaeon]|nr:carboxylating nicotinate-nucleotide diphosphorylase [Thermoplasmata archaeon]NIS12765.1 carboxylating nicotinate-nucleotide diphosphorylase [Thermoplasmata archaeon]NIS19700.1 carboxylating nicotinate-nucleotide diphosphorylase [Thermoplasmata archaeon]NIT76883.1 carboxylating nicotinate-nucleotide diphosphorylase [Thermoplasmata archaeon]NIU48811.1 carboxylating nicotinate-nucleotide diphosphorylase [Thermoplasmata archaeon]